MPFTRVLTTPFAEDVFEEVEPAEAPAEETLDDSSQEPAETPKARTERKRRIPPEPKVINTLDITTEPMPLRTFIEQKGPQKSQDRIVAVAVWLKKHRGLDEITRDHLYTVYQQMGGSGDWKAANDFDKVLRQLGNRKSWFEKGVAEASFRTTIIATNYVDGMTLAQN